MGEIFSKFEYLTSIYAHYGQQVREFPTVCMEAVLYFMVVRVKKCDLDSFGRSRIDGCAI